MTYWSIRIYFKYYKLQSVLKILEMFYEFKFWKSFAMESTIYLIMEKYKISSIKKCFCCPNPLGRHYLFKILHAHLTHC